MNRAVIFDLDDTLYAERDYAFSGFAAVARTFANELGDVSHVIERMHRLFDSEHRRRVFNRLLEELNLGEQASVLVPKMIEAYRCHKPDISLGPDARRVLQALTGRYKLGLITDGPARMQRAKLEALRLTERGASSGTHRLESGDTPSGLHHAEVGDNPDDVIKMGFVFDAIIVTDELGPDMGKPHPGAFERMADRLGVAHDACMYVADNPAKDFVAPNRLGWRTVRVVRPGGVYAEAVPAGDGAPQETISSLDELSALLDRNP